MAKVDRRQPRIAYPDTLEVEGNKGGSYVRLDRAGMPEGMVRLEVGETCVRTINQDISVAALAVILTVAKDIGFQKIVDEYCRSGNGTPIVSVEHDL